MIWAALTVGTLIVLAILFLWGRRWGKPKLSAADRRKMEKRWASVLQLQDPHRKVMEADKILDAVLGDAGFQGTMGDKLKKAGKYIPDLNGVWSAHKLRNRIAHEPDVSLSEQDVGRALVTFEKAIRSFVR